MSFIQLFHFFNRYRDSTAATLLASTAKTNFLASYLLHKNDKNTTKNTDQGGDIIGQIASQV